MQKSLFMAVAAVCMMIGVSAFAQKPMQKSAEEMAQMKADKLKSELMLNDQQTKQVYEQLLWNVKQKREDASQIWAKTDKKMKEVLSSEQYTKWAQMQADKVEKNKMHAPRHDKSGNHPMKH